MSSMTSSKSRKAKKQFQQAWSDACESLEQRMLFSVPTPLVSTAIGTPTGGSASYSSGTYTVTGAGYDLIGANDAFQYTYEPINGPSTIIVEVNSETANSEHSIAGLDVRASTAPNAADLVLGVRDNGSVFANSRDQTGESGVLNNIGTGALTFPVYLKLTINAVNEVKGYFSTDGGTTYNQICDTYIGFENNSYLAGMAVCSQTAPTTLNTTTFTNFSATAANGLTTAVNAPNTAGTQVGPYQFTATYTDGTNLNASTIASDNFTVTAPDSTSVPVTLVSTGLTDNTTITATYQIPELTQLGDYTITDADNVADYAGHTSSLTAPVVFSVTPDTQPPTAALTATDVIVGSTSPYTFKVTYTDNGLVNPSTLGNSNISVVLPSGATETPTLETSGLSPASTEVVTYEIPNPTAIGTYTIKIGSSPVADETGNPMTAGATLGTFSVSDANTINGSVLTTSQSPVSGATVFVDEAGTGVFTSGDPTATTNSSGQFSLANVPDGTFKLIEEAPAGQQVLAPSSGVSETVSNGETLSGVTFINTSANNSASTVNLTGTFKNRFAASIKVGGAASASVLIRNTGTTTATGTVYVTLLLTTDGTAATSVATLKTARVNLKLKANKTASVALPYKIPGSVAIGNYKLVAIVDSTNVISETNKLDNVVASSTVAIIASKTKKK